MTFTNVKADAVVTTEWLSTGDTTLVVPVYQRQYRWEIEGCDRLLRDLRAVARVETGHTHFLGSILYTTTSSGRGHRADAGRRSAAGHHTDASPRRHP